MAQTYNLVVNRNDIRESRLLEAPAAPLAPGQARLRIDHFALTANNITYAAFGDAMKYWNFFPTEAGWGRVPVWGFADVVESTVEGVKVGERFYGYYPMAQELIVEPSRISASSFTDAAAHRAELHMLYNQYLRTTHDPSYSADSEAQQVLLRPLFITSFVIEDFFDDQQCFGAEQIIISSASSKTSYGTAFAFHHRKAKLGRGPKVVGLTSPRNRAFVESLGCYDVVISYDELASLPKVPSAYIDMAGGMGLRRAVHEHFAEDLKHSCVIGNTQWDQGALTQPEKSEPLPGAKPTFFFAPAQIKKRFADWTPAGFAERLGVTWQAFLQPVMHGTPAWMNVIEHSGPQALQALYKDMVAGEVDPRLGHVVKP